MENQNTGLAERTMEGLTTLRNEWGKLAELKQTVLTQLQLNCSAAVTALSAALPAAVEDIPAAEKALSIAGNTYKEEQERRMGVTKLFDGVIEQMMEPEKSIKRQIEITKAALLTVKKIKDDQDRAAALRNSEIARFRELSTMHIISQISKFEAVINAKVLACYEYALKNKIAPVDLQMDKMRDALKAESFEIQPIQTIGRVLLNDDEVFEIWRQMKAEKAEIIRTPESWLFTYQTALNKQFEFYSVALKNSEAAIEAAKELAAKEAEASAKLASDAAAMAKVESSSVNMEVNAGGGGKALKSVWLLDIADDEAGTRLIATAFLANWSLCYPETPKLKSAQSLSVTQMKTALEKIKNKDAKFEVSGLKWKEDRKL